MMADIELVIKIPEYYYENSIKKELPIYLSEDNIVAILTKGHGRLINADALKMDKRVCGDRYLSKTSLFVANKVIEQAPTIIEADTAESEDKV